MIFQTAGAIDLIIAGSKTQTRRLAGPLATGDDREGVEMISYPNGIEAVQRLRANRWITRYKLGHDYAVQPGRGKPGRRITIPSQLPPELWDTMPLRIRITAIGREDIRHISEQDALAEGGYTPIEYLRLWASMYDKSLYFPVEKPGVYQEATMRTIIEIHTMLKDRPADRYDAWALTFEVVK